MLELTFFCQRKYGSFRSIDSRELPPDLRFVNKDQLPLKTPNCLTASLHERWTAFANDYNYMCQLLLKSHRMHQRLLQNEDVYVLKDLLEAGERNYEVLKCDDIGISLSLF